jgi:hypothetical protein
MNRFLIACLTCLIAAASLLVTATPAEACTRCLKVFADGTVVVGRSMDWVEDPGSELWIYPRGMKRQGNAGPGSLEWTATYGSVGVTFTAWRPPASRGKGSSPRPRVEGKPGQWESTVITEWRSGPSPRAGVLRGRFRCAGNS